LRRSVSQTGAVTDTKAVILRAATKLLNDDGLEKITIRNVAGASHVGRTTVMHHFGDKQGLLDALHLVALAQLADTIASTRFAVFGDDGNAQSILDELDMEQPDGAPEIGIDTYAQFRRVCPGYWEILRFRRCPNFERKEVPEVFRLIEAVVGGPLQAPIGPTVDLCLHQLLALHEWIGVATPSDAFRLMKRQTSLEYWLAILRPTL
jgi:AcrR family transcriptional regulator